jgi:ABC-type polysaccharide/polyol phosphate transport system ATPase subunit
MSVIEIRDVSKTFSRRTTPKLLREHVQNTFRKGDDHTFYALKDVTFNVEKAEGVQIVGANGAGKTTLLGLVIGLTKPDTGSIVVQGRMGALLELGSGFHPDLTGRENLVLNAALIGFDESQVTELTPKIIAFSELDDVMEEPLRSYSAGMIMRLAFAVAVSLEPDVLIVDEILSVGDLAFQQKCFQEILRLRKRGMSLLCVSHGAGPSEQLCSRAIWLHEGEVVLDGRYSDTLNRYYQYMQHRDPKYLPRENPDRILVQGR